MLETSVSFSLLYKEYHVIFVSVILVVKRNNPSVDVLAILKYTNTDV